MLGQTGSVCNVILGIVKKNRQSHPRLSATKSIQEVSLLVHLLGLAEQTTFARSNTPCRFLIGS